jgi:ribosome-binding factor A
MSARRREHASHSPYQRTARVNEVLREVLAEALERMSDTDERLSLVTVTGIETSPDLSRAVVYLGSLGESMAAALSEHRVELQRIVGSEVRMKRTPHLEFVADPAVAHGARVEEILRKVHSAHEPEGDEQSPGPGSMEADPG